MKLLVVDNTTSKMHELVHALNGCEYDIISYRKLGKNSLKDYDKIILSGGHAFSALRPCKKYKKEIEIIKSSKIPIFGICLGFQLICRAYGAHMHDIVHYEHGLLKINKVKNDLLLNGLPKSFFVYENHRHVVKSVSSKLIPLAFSKDGIEAVKHESRPIWGMQFHPEHLVKNNFGTKILYNFLKL